jgi:hypothetical protein
LELLFGIMFIRINISGGMIAGKGGGDKNTILYF